MSRRPAKVTQADIARAIRAAKKAGASAVTVQGIIRIALSANAAPVNPGTDVDDIWVPSQALQRYLKSTESG